MLGSRRREDGRRRRPAKRTRQNQETPQNCWKNGDGGTQAVLNVSASCQQVMYMYMYVCVRWGVGGFIEC